MADPDSSARATLEEDELPLVYPHLESNFRLANYFRRHAYSKLIHCLNEGYSHPNQDRYQAREIVLNSPWSDKKTLKRTRLLMKEAFEIDQIRTEIETSIANDLPSEQAKPLIKELRHYDCKPLWTRLVAPPLLWCMPVNLEEVGRTLLLSGGRAWWKPGGLENADPTAFLFHLYEVNLQKLVVLWSYQHGFTYVRNRAAVQFPFYSAHGDDRLWSACRDRTRRWEEDPCFWTAEQVESMKKAKSGPVKSSEETTSDPVIEQWYTDPYNRYNPEGAAGKALRKQVLTTALRNRGFRGYRVTSIVNWLIRCNGRFKAFDQLVRSNKRKVKVQERERSEVRSGISTPVRSSPTKRSRRADKSTVDSAQTTTPLKTPLKLGITSPVLHTASPASARNSPNTTPEDSTLDKIGPSVLNESTDSFTKILATAAIDEDQNIEIGSDEESEDFYPFANDAEREAVMRQLKDEIVGVRSTFHSVHKPGTQAYQDDHDDWYLEELKRTQSFWNIIYGDDLDQDSGNKADNNDWSDEDDEDENDVKFTYFRDPQGAPTADVQYRTQGLKPLRRVKHNGREVWTEDESFGLYVPPKHERLG